MRKKINKQKTIIESENRGDTHAFLIDEGDMEETKSSGILVKSKVSICDFSNKESSSVIDQDPDDDIEISKT